MTQENKNTEADSLLGQPVKYSSSYDPRLLYPIERKQKRSEIGIGNSIPFDGADVWNAYELSWLNSNGLPQVAIGSFTFAASTRCIVESKSLKLYLNSLNQKRFDSMSDFADCIQKDISEAIGDKVAVNLSSLDGHPDFEISRVSGELIDNLDVAISEYQYDASVLCVTNTDSSVTETLCSNLMKSNCLITNQPDWATVVIEYTGSPLCKSSLLRYLVSFRTHNEFHEQCVERVYMDIMQTCKPEKLTVYARYTRRGGLDINPWRSNCEQAVENRRLIRQ